MVKTTLSFIAAALLGGCASVPAYDTDYAQPDPVTMFEQATQADGPSEPGGYGPTDPMYDYASAAFGYPFHVAANFTDDFAYPYYDPAFGFGIGDGYWHGGYHHHQVGSWNGERYDHAFHEHRAFHGYGAYHSYGVDHGHGFFHGYREMHGFGGGTVHAGMHGFAHSSGFGGAHGGGGHGGPGGIGR
jgi:hypothetical protein